MPPAQRSHPFMPNSVPAIKQELLAALGIESTQELFAQIPADHRLREPLSLPPALSAETELSRHMLGILSKNVSCEAALSFLGGGCWQHHVPAIVRRNRPAYGIPDAGVGHGIVGSRPQPGVVRVHAASSASCSSWIWSALPVYSWGCAAGHAIRMAARLTGRSKVLVPRYLDPERRAVIANYCEPAQMPSHIAMIDVASDAQTGQLDLADLQAKLTRDALPCTSRIPAISVRSRRTRRRSARWRARPARRRSSASIRSRSAILAPPGTTAPTSSSARFSRSAFI